MMQQGTRRLNAGENMYFQSGEPTLDEMLSASTVITMMKGDGVEPDDLRVLLCEMSRRLKCHRAFRRSSGYLMPGVPIRHGVRERHRA
jgi:hypothetical protein